MMKLPDILLATIVAAIWGFNFVVIHVGINSFPPLMFSALRFILATFPLIFFCPRPDVSWKIILGIGMVLGVIKFGFLFIGMDAGLSAGLASLVLQAQVFFTVILAAFIYKERPTIGHILGIIIAFSGIGLVATTVDTNATLVGLVLVLTAAFAWAVSNLLMKKAGAVNMLHLMVWVCLVPPIPLIGLSLIFEGWQENMKAFAEIDVTGIGAVLYISYLATILGFAAWGRLIRKYGAGRVAPFSLLVPVFGMISSAVFLGEQFGPTRIIAVALVIGGLVLTVLKPKVLGLTSPQNSDRER